MAKAMPPSPRGRAVTPAATSRWRDYFKAIGPGLITGASDDDPSGIATYAQAGAKYGPSFLWVALVSFPLMAAVQEICDRSALATGAGLGELAAQRFKAAGRSVVAVLLGVLIIANALNIAADLVAIGSGMNLLHAGPTWLWALLAGVVITTVIIIGSFARLSQIFKILTMALLAYIIVAVIVTHQWRSVLYHTLEPHVQFNKGYIALLVAIMGTTISPYLFFWQSANRLEEMREEPEGGDEPLPLSGRRVERAKRKQRTARLDVFSGMALSNIVMFAIIATTAATLNLHHQTNIQSAAQAASSLRPLAGHFASVIFAMGFIGSGLLAIPVLAASGSVGLAGLRGKKWGFSRSPLEAPVFYALVSVGTVGGTALSLLSVNPIKLLVFVAVINGVIAAPLLVVVMLVATNRQIMGDYVNGRISNFLGWFTVAVMGVASIALVATGGL